MSGAEKNLTKKNPTHQEWKMIKSRFYITLFFCSYHDFWTDPILDHRAFFPGRRNTDEDSCSLVRSQKKISSQKIQHTKNEKWSEADSTSLWVFCSYRDFWIASQTRCPSDQGYFFPGRRNTAQKSCCSVQSRLATCPIHQYSSKKVQEGLVLKMIRRIGAENDQEPMLHNSDP